MADNVSPRINSSLLQKYRGKTVRLVGKVMEKHADYALVEASDRGQVQVLLNPESNYSTDLFVEIFGKVNQDLTIQESTFGSLGTSFNLESYDRSIKLAQKFPQVMGW